LCPEAPVPVLNIADQRENPGMAGNVRRNIESLSGKSVDICTNDNWYEVVKTRYVHKESNHMFFRVDTTQLIPRINVKNIDFDYDLIVISDYNKGFLLKEDIKYICSNHKNVFIDTKKILGDWVNEARFIKINDYEFSNSENHLDLTTKKRIIHTMGGRGCEYMGNRYPTKKVEVKDLSGAGDTFMAGLVVKFVETDNIIDSIKYANECASKVVTQKGVAVL
jgi:bifunctional ADP-heptose synthase (sugar kinase/adenylyltransferase)|tara:strand:+ start:1671 stop:2336 length:666 start_codon:yes stop_codon:yes gene_type:complete